MSIQPARFTPDKFAVTTGIVTSILTCLVMKAFKKKYLSYAQYTIPLNVGVIAGSYLWAKNRNLTPSLQLNPRLKEEDRNRLNQMVPVQPLYRPYLKLWSNLEKIPTTRALSLSVKNLDLFLAALENTSLQAERIDLDCTEAELLTILASIEKLSKQVPSLKMIRLLHLDTLDTTTLTLEQKKLFGNLVHLPDLKQLTCDHFELANRLLENLNQVNVKLKTRFTNPQILELLSLQPASLDLREVQCLEKGLIEDLKDLDSVPLIHLPPYLYGDPHFPDGGPLRWSLVEISRRALCEDHKTLTPFEVALWLKDDDYIHLQGENNIERIVADHVPTLTDDNCIAFCKKFPKLTSLTLYHCPGITKHGVKSLKKTFPLLNVSYTKIEEQKSINLIDLTLGEFKAILSKDKLRLQLPERKQMLLQQDKISFEDLGWPDTLNQEALLALASWMETSQLPQMISSEALKQLWEIAHPNYGPYLSNLRRSVEMRLRFSVDLANIDPIYQFAMEKNIGPLKSACQIYAHIYMLDWEKKEKKFDPSGITYFDLKMQPQWTDKESELGLHSDLLYAYPMLHDYLEKESAHANTSITIDAKSLNSDTWITFVDFLYGKEIRPIADTCIRLHQLSLLWDMKDLKQKSLGLLQSHQGTFEEQQQIFIYLCESDEPKAAMTQLQILCKSHLNSHSTTIKELISNYLIGNPNYSESLNTLASQYPSVCPPTLTIPLMTPDNAEKIISTLDELSDLDMVLIRIKNTFPSNLQQWALNLLYQRNTQLLNKWDN